MPPRIVPVLLSLLIVAGCGRKPVEAPAPPAEPKKAGVSIESSDAPPPPAPVTTQTPREDAPARPGQPPPDAPPVAEATPESATKQFAEAEKAEKAYQQRLKRNTTWLQALQKANGSEQQRILGEIHAANLSPAEIQELEAIKQYFGVTVSFR